MTGKILKPWIKPRYQYWALVLPMSFVFITFFAMINYPNKQYKKHIKIGLLFVVYGYLYYSLPDFFPNFAWNTFYNVIYMIVMSFPMGLYLIKQQEADFNQSANEEVLENGNQD